MSIQPHPKYPNVWVIRYYPHGRKKDPATGRPSNNRETIYFEGKEADARAYYVDLLRTAAPPAEIMLAPSLKQAWPSFCGYYKLHVAPSTYRDYLCTWGQHLEPFFGKFRPHLLTPKLIEQYKEQRREKQTVRGGPTSKKTINKELSYLSAMTTWMARPEINMAKPLHFAIRGFPARQIKAPLPVIPSRKDMIFFLRAANREYRAIFALCYYAGLRKTEATTIKGRHINLSQGYLQITGKGSKERIVPIHRKLRVYLRKRWTREYLFINPNTGRPYTDLRRAIDRAAEKAGLDAHIYLHLLRHSFGTHSIQSGIDLRSVQLLMGHSSSQITEIYTTLAATFLSQQMDRFGSGALRRPNRKKISSVK